MQGLEYYQPHAGFDWMGFAAFITAMGVFITTGVTLAFQIMDRREKRKRAVGDNRRERKLDKVAAAVGVDADGDGKPDA